jgi:hypothetical protein
MGYEALEHELHIRSRCFQAVCDYTPACSASCIERQSYSTLNCTELLDAGVSKEEMVIE